MLPGAELPHYRPRNFSVPFEISWVWHQTRLRAFRPIISGKPGKRNHGSCGLDCFHWRRVGCTPRCKTDRKWSHALGVPSYRENQPSLGTEGADSTLGFGSLN
jgi:hypothetical protein